MIEMLGVGRQSSLQSGDFPSQASLSLDIQGNGRLEGDHRPAQFTSV
jgi:hypothetical protein